MISPIANLSFLTALERVTGHQDTEIKMFPTSPWKAKLEGDSLYRGISAGCETWKDRGGLPSDA
jgi:hypothetical protein